MVGVLCIAAAGAWHGSAPTTRARPGDEEREVAPSLTFPEVTPVERPPPAPHEATTTGTAPRLALGEQPSRDGHARHGQRQHASHLHERASCDTLSITRSRVVLLRSFEEHGTALGEDASERPGYPGSLLVSPELDPAIPSHLLWLLLSQAVPRRVDETLGTRSAPPDIVLYRDLTELRAHSCVRQEAVAFYDGTLHLAWTGDFRELQISLVHELVHHALSTVDADVPVWLQEGAALTVSGEHMDPTTTATLPMRAMAYGFSSEASARDVAHFYEQARAMVSFLRTLLRFRLHGTLEPLVLALVERQTDASSLFEWATRRWVDDLPDAPLSFADDYWSRGETLSEAWSERLLARTRLPMPGTDPRTLVLGAELAATSRR